MSGPVKLFQVVTLSFVSPQIFMQLHFQNIIFRALIEKFLFDTLLHANFDSYLIVR